MLIDKQPKGRIKPPGSKSVSHRALICAALSGSGKIRGAADNDDIRATLRCLETFGAAYHIISGDIVFISGVKALKEGTIINCGESGSTMRFLIPLAAAIGSSVYFTGEGRLMDRPMDTYAESFEGRAQLQKEGNTFKVSGKLTSGIYKLPGHISSQFVSGFLFALPLLEGDSVIEITSPLQSKAYVDLTLDSLEAFGIKVINENYHRFIIPGGQVYKSRDYAVESDYSGASFFLAAAALGCDIEITGLNSNSRQGDKKFLDILLECGANISWINKDTVKVDAEKLNYVSVDVSEIPDIVPPLAVLMCFCKGGGEITNAARLRIKECDRLMAVTKELNKLGAKIEEGPDYLKISQVDCLKGGKCHAHNDHRIAMMVSVASIKATEPVYIDNPECVKKSYPDFWKDFLKD